MKNPFRRLRDFVLGRQDENGYYYGQDLAQNEQQAGGEDQRQLYTALDIGTAFAKAIIIEVQDDVGVVGEERPSRG